MWLVPHGSLPRSPLRRLKVQAYAMFRLIFPSSVAGYVWLHFPLLLPSFHHTIAIYRRCLRPHITYPSTSWSDRSADVASSSLPIVHPMLLADIRCWTNMWLIDWQKKTLQCEWVAQERCTVVTCCWLSVLNFFFTLPSAAVANKGFLSLGLFWVAISWLTQEGSPWKYTTIGSP